MYIISIICLMYLLINLVNTFPSQLEEHVNIETHNKSISEIVNEQTEVIKKIMARQNNQTEKSIITKKETETKIKQQEKEKLSVDDLKIQCQYFFQTVKNNTKVEAKNKQNDLVTTTAKPFRVTKLPTQISTTTPKITTEKNDNNVKFLKLEPVILQKTILRDGKIIYYWHKALPNLLPYTNVQPQQKYEPVQTSTLTPINKQPQAFETIKQESPMKEKITEQPYVHQMKFILPIPHSNNKNFESPQFDQYAYYPKHLQPETMNVQMPYVPVFHMIKAITVPNVDESENHRTNYDNVNLK